MKTAIKIAALTSILLSSAAAIAADTASDSALSGRWDAVLTRNGTEIPFRLDIKGSGADLQGVFYDGFKPYDGTTSASFKDGKLVLNVEHYLTTINATLKTYVDALGVLQRGNIEWSTRETKRYPHIYQFPETQTATH